MQRIPIQSTSLGLYSKNTSMKSLPAWREANHVWSLVFESAHVDDLAWPLADLLEVAATAAKTTGKIRLRRMVAPSQRRYFATGRTALVAVDCSLGSRFSTSLSQFVPPATVVVSMSEERATLTATIRSIRTITTVAGRWIPVNFDWS